MTFGLFGELTEAQQKSLWFWTAQGVKNPDDPDTYRKAVARIRELGKHAEECGIEVSLEMYEDTYVGTADGAVRFVNDVDVLAVGINADIGISIALVLGFIVALSMFRYKNFGRVMDSFVYFCYPRADQDARLLSAHAMLTYHNGQPLRAPPLRLRGRGIGHANANNLTLDGLRLHCFLPARLD